MRIGIPHWNGRVSPVLDSAESLLVLEVAEDGSCVRSESRVEGGSIPSRASNLAGLGLDVLVCGAVSRELAEMLEASGLSLIPWVAGDIEDVIAASLGGGIDAPRFSMPGCCGRGFGRGRGGGRAQGRGTGQGRGMGPGQGRGAGRGMGPGQGRGAGGGAGRGENRGTGRGRGTKRGSGGGRRQT